MRFLVSSLLFLKNEHLIPSFFFLDVADASFSETSFATVEYDWVLVVNVRRVYKANRKIISLVTHASQTSGSFSLLKLSIGVITLSLLAFEPDLSITLV